MLNKNEVKGKAKEIKGSIKDKVGEMTGNRNLEAEGEAEEAGQVFNRHFMVGLGSGDGAFNIYVSPTTDMVVDVSGYFAP